ncbi:MULTISPECIES: hypothetical protein [Microbacterium]|uniref:hypothetical protein n=1 Tax=Microbacterium TaxID=33882 RepID=UPI0011B0E132|nr:hypothetical protein [Microbacterium sp. MYb72]
MSDATTTTWVQRGPVKKLLTAVCAVLVACTIAALGSAPAEATDNRCTANQVGVLCGIFYNTSGVSIRIGTNFSGTTNVGTVTGVTATLDSYKNSNIFKDSSGRFYDWDAVYVGPKSCLAMKVGAGLGTPTSYRNTGTTGVWYKVNNLGANVTMLRPC